MTNLGERLYRLGVPKQDRWADVTSLWEEPRHEPVAALPETRNRVVYDEHGLPIRCVAGHELNEETLYWTAKRDWHCRTCHAERQARYRREKADGTAQAIGRRRLEETG